MNVNGIGTGPWQDRLGAVVDDNGAGFCVWAPSHGGVDLILHPGESRERAIPLERQPDGTFSTYAEAVVPGDRYGYRLDRADRWFPDPCSRWQPDGVHGASMVVDPRAFAWSDERWVGVALERAVFYELHVGTFTAAGTFRAAAERLPYLVDLGVTVVELMPVAQCPGAYNWGYDGASLFAPSRAYGTPDDLRHLVDRAHALGLALVLDVVYNHFGPDGAYVFAFSPFYRSEQHESPWGAAVNLDGDHAAGVRAFFIANARYWVREFHVDGFRLDATHALTDRSPVHFLDELTRAVRSEAGSRTVLIVAEDDRNLDTILRTPQEGGWALDAVWADDFHHVLHRRVTGEADGYYADYAGTLDELAATLRRGWLYEGQPSAFAGRRRGTSASGIPLERMVICLQNHDQIGNRAFGRRLNQLIDAASYRALAPLLLLAPETPLLFMGQEWAASTPFQYFTDHHEELGRQVTLGRRAEFARFTEFTDPATRERIPDPQAASTFEASRLQWGELGLGTHRGTLRLYQDLLRLRREDAALRPGGSMAVQVQDERAVAITRAAPDGSSLMIVAWFGSGGLFAPAADAARAGWTVVLTTDDGRFADGDGSAPPRLVDEATGQIRFERTSAVVLRGR